QHVSVWTKKERIRNRVTGEYEEPDEKLMREVERLLDVKVDPHDARKQMISAIAAFAIDHPNAKIEPAVIFPHYLKRMRDAIFGERRPAVAQRARDIEIVIRDEGTGLDEQRKRNAEASIEKLITRFGYCRNCAADAASVLVRRRFHDLTT
ncbi:MAG: serine protein kinase PrkA, partial [Polyangiaceae bacterium]